MEGGVQEAGWSEAEMELVRETRSSDYQINYRGYGQDLAERFLMFGVGVIKLVARLPQTFAGKHIGGQLLRSGTSSGANYEEARGAESRADFVHKMGVVLKEMKESRYWLRIIAAADMLPLPEVHPPLNEAEELCSITARSIFTAKRNS